MMSIAARRTLYENWSVFGPDGTLMFRTNAKRAQWYVARGLARQFDDKAIRLNFQPNGPGSAGDHYYLQDHNNECCVCGSAQDLVIKHVVPFAYRRWFPEQLKNHSSHDLLPMCIACAKAWERHSVLFGKELCEMHGVPVNGLMADSFAHLLALKAKKAAVALLRHDRIPQDRRMHLMSVISSVYPHMNEHCKTTWQWAANTPKPAVEPAGKFIVERYDGNAPAIHRGVIFPWRAAFVAGMKPKHLPAGWSITRVGR